MVGRPEQASEEANVVFYRRPRSGWRGGWNSSPSMYLNLGKYKTVQGTVEEVLKSTKAGRNKSAKAKVVSRRS